MSPTGTGPSGATLAGVRRGAALAGAVALALALSGCALLAVGTRRSVPVTSQPDGAEVVLDGRRVGTTPLELSVDPTVDHELVVRTDVASRLVILRSRVLGPGAGYLLLDLVPSAAAVGAGVLLSRSLPACAQPGGCGTPPLLVLGTAAAAAAPFVIDLGSGAVNGVEPVAVRIRFE